MAEKKKSATTATAKKVVVKRKSAVKKPKIIPYHQWTHDGDRVLILKCVDADMKSHDGFVWPTSGPVRPLKWSRDPTCESGGLFGWAWGIAFGEGKVPNYQGKWIVYAAHPDDVILVDGKVKAVPDDELNRTPEVVFCGSCHDAMQVILDGQVAWIQQASQGESSVTGDQSASSATGDQSASSATGDQSASSATGYRSASSATGDRSASSATGDQSASSATGDQSASSATGYRSASSATGYRSIAAGTRDLVTIEVMATGLAAVTADVFFWRWRVGSAVCQRTPKGVFLLEAKDVNAKDGEILRVEHGIIQERK